MSRMLCVDPGETVGWSIWSNGKLLGGGQTPLWEFAFDVQDAVRDNIGPLAELQPELLHAGVAPEDNSGGIDKFVIEKFAIYPWAAKDLAFDECRTSQLIGALTFLALDYQIELHKQPASIKKRAEAGGAKELFVRPLVENRHQNDSIMHGFFYTQVVEKGINLNIKDGTDG